VVSKSTKIGVAVALLAAAAGVAAWAAFGGRPEVGGAGKPAVLKCTACGTAEETTWDKVFARGTHEVPGRGWVAPCGKCGKDAIGSNR
jgi:hypothetical protein